MNSSQTSPPGQPKILSIQALRGLAAALVVYMHAMIHATALNIGDSVQQQFFFLASFGAVGVDIFFVISGFIITVVSGKFLREHGVQDFFVKRLIRIVPIYWLLSLVELTNSLLQHPERLSIDAIIKTIVILPIIDQKQFVFPVLNLGWTLAFELYFYLVVGLFLFTKRRTFILYASSFMLTLIGLGFVVPDMAYPMFEFMTNPMILEFLAGCLIGWWFQNKAKPGMGISWGLIISSMIIFAMTIGLDNSSISKAENVIHDANLAVLRVLLWGIPSTAIVAGLLFLESNRSLPVHRSLILFGDASYSIYLTHFFSLTVFDKIWLLLKLKSPDILIIAAVIFSIAVGVIFYLIVEKTLLEYLNSKYSAYCQHRNRQARLPLPIGKKE